MDACLGPKLDCVCVSVICLLLIVSDQRHAPTCARAGSRQCWEQDPLVTFQVRNTFLELCNVDTGLGTPRGAAQ